MVMPASSQWLKNRAIKSLAAAGSVLVAVKVDADDDQRVGGRDCAVRGAVGVQPHPEMASPVGLLGMVGVTSAFLSPVRVLVGRS